MSTDALRYDSPNTFTRRQRLILWLVPPLIALLLKVTFLWCRSFELRHREYIIRLRASNTPIVLGFWHESMALATWAHRGYEAHTLTSYSFDGELAARVVSWFGFRALRGSSSKGGTNALDQMQRALGENPMLGFTLDGPRGPRRRSKPGAVMVAARTGAVILPNAYAVSAAWRLKSWDRFPIPKPFARVICDYAEPIIVEDVTSRTAVMEATRAVEAALNTLHRQLEMELGQDSIPG